MAKSDGNSSHCARKDTAANGTRVGMPNFHFSGIPETLIINSVIALILLIVFIALKKSAWAFKKFNVKGDAGKFAAIFYGPPSDLSPRTSPLGTEEGSPGSDEDVGTREEQELIKEGSGALSWIGVAAFKLKERHFRRRCGQDAVEYLYFQRLLITILSIATVATLAILLPIDVVLGTLLWTDDMEDYYGVTTLSNINASTYWVLFHIGLTILLFPLVVVLVRRVLRIRLKSKIHDDRQWAVSLHAVLRKLHAPNGELHAFSRLLPIQRYRTLMISNVTTINPNSGDEVIDKNLIRRHFDESHPKVHIDAIDFTYDTTKLRAVIDEKRRLDFCLEFYAARQAEHDESKSLIRPAKCKLCCGSCRGEEVDGEQFYRHEVDAINQKMQRKYQKLEQKPANVVFVTFESHEQAEQVNHDFNWAERVCCCGLCTRRKPRQSSVGEQLGVNVWNVRYAPLPRFVNWSNLSYGGWMWWLRSIAINFVIFVIVFFFSTPPLVLSFLSDKVGFLMQIPIFSQWLPTILLLGIPILLPIVILLSVQWIGYYSMVTQLSYQLRNLFLFLLLTLVILPGVGMTSADAVFQWLRGQVGIPGQNATNQMQWDCVFIPSSGAFFVNFIIGLALIGNALDLLRIGPLVWFEIQRLAFARTEAEQAWINLQRAEFPYASHYATMLIVYSIAVVYGFICPLVMPFGLMYMLIKHVIDKYNLFFSSSTNTFESLSSGGAETSRAASKLSTGMHITATRYLFFALFIQQFILTFFAVIRQVPVLAYVIILVCTIATGLFLVYEFWFAEYVDPELVEAYHEQLEKDSLNYEPPVLREYKQFMSPSSSGRGSRNRSGNDGVGEEEVGSSSSSRNNATNMPRRTTNGGSGGGGFDGGHQMNQSVALQMQPQ